MIYCHVSQYFTFVSFGSLPVYLFSNVVLLRFFVVMLPVVVAVVVGGKALTRGTV